MSQNTLKSKNHRMIIQNLPNVSFYCISSNLPGLSLGVSETGTPFTNVKLAGDTLNYSPLSISFLVDENLNNWKEIFDWMIGLSAPEQFSQYTNLQNKEDGRKITEYSDGTLILYTNMMNKNLEVFFHDLFPINLSDIEFNTQNEDSQVLVATATFEYQNYNFRS